MKLEFYLIEAVDKTAKKEFDAKVKVVPKSPWYLNMVAWVITAVFVLSLISLIANFNKQASLNVDYLVYMGFFVGSFVCFILVGSITLRINHTKTKIEPMKVSVHFGETSVRYEYQNGVVSEFPYGSIYEVFESKTNLMFLIDGLTFFFVPLSAIQGDRVKEDIIEKIKTGSGS